MTEDLRPEMADPVNDTNASAILSAGAALGIPRINPHQESRAYAIIPDKYKLQYLEREEVPERHKGSVAMHDAGSFIRYFNEQCTDHSRIYASQSPVAFIGVLNDHASMIPCWRDFRVTFSPQPSKEWTEWLSKNRKEFDGNQPFAEWLEDNMLDICDPAPAKMMDIALNFKAKQTTDFANSVNLNNGNLDLTFVANVDASSRNAAGNKIVIPEKFQIQIPVFAGIGEPKYKISARFRYKISGDSRGVKLRFELERPHKVQELAFTELLAKIGGGVERHIFFGAP